MKLSVVWRKIFPPRRNYVDDGYPQDEAAERGCDVGKMTERPDIDAIETEANDTLDACEYGEAVALRKVLRLCAYVRDLEANRTELHQELNYYTGTPVAMYEQYTTDQARISELEKALEPFANAHTDALKTLSGFGTWDMPDEAVFENAARVFRGES